jgi:hypothetical protein
MALRSFISCEGVEGVATATEYSSFLGRVGAEPGSEKGGGRRQKRGYGGGAAARALV